MPFEKGKEKTGGRQKGVVNKTTATFKELVSQTVQELQKNHKTSLASFAKNHPKEFWAIAAKLIPTELSGSVQATVIKVIRE